MSLFVFAGSSQFIALTLLAGGTGLVVILLTTLVVNLRHALYSATLLPHVAGLPQRWRVPLAFWLTDETFAVVLRRYQARDGSPYKHWSYLGSGISMYDQLVRLDPGRAYAGTVPAPPGTPGAGIRHGCHLHRHRGPHAQATGPCWAPPWALRATALAAQGLPYKLRADGGGPGRA